MVDKSLLERVVVVQTAFLGDAFLTLPMIRELRNKFPVEELYVVTTPETMEAFRTEPAIDEIIVFDKRGNFAQKSFQNVRKILQQKGIITAVLPHRSLRSAWLIYSAGIRHRVGFAVGAAAALYTMRVPYHYALPDAIRNISLLRAFDKSISVYNNWFTQPCKKIADPDTRIAIFPGSQWKTKRWLPERFAEVAAHCVSKGWAVDLCGTGNEKELCAMIVGTVHSPIIVNHCGITTLQEVRNIIQNAALVLTNDSAPIHFANELGTPVIAIFGPTSPEFGFAPRGIYDVVIQAEGLLCQPCAIHGGDYCPVRTHKCMKDVTSAQVINAIENLMILPFQHENSLN